MKIKIDITEKEREISLMKEHSMYKDDNPSGCCHCELCSECDSILSKVKKAIKGAKKIK